VTLTFVRAQFRLSATCTATAPELGVAGRQKIEQSSRKERISKLLEQNTKRKFHKGTNLFFSDKVCCISQAASECARCSSLPRGGLPYTAHKQSDKVRCLPFPTPTYPPRLTFTNRLHRVILLADVFRHYLDPFDSFSSTHRVDNSALSLTLLAPTEIESVALVVFLYVCTCPILPFLPLSYLSNTALPASVVPIQYCPSCLCRTYPILPFLPPSYTWPALPPQSTSLYPSRPPSAIHRYPVEADPDNPSHTPSPTLLLALLPSHPTPASLSEIHYSNTSSRTQPAHPSDHLVDLNSHKFDKRPELGIFLTRAHSY
jgi:hypothetical protein